MAIALLAGGGGGNGGEHRPAAPVHHLLPLRFERGANVTAYTEAGLAGDGADQALIALARIGANAVTLPVLWFQDQKTSSDITPDTGQTPSDRSLRHAIAVSHLLGLRVTIAPLIQVRDGTFRGDIEPADRAAWYRSYRRMLGHYALIAQQMLATRLVVGSELSSMASDDQAWRALIAMARSRFDGQLTFAANWVQGAERIGFWDALDAVGVDVYMPLFPAANPSEADLEQAWQPWIGRLQTVHNQTGKPVVITEFGYASRLGAVTKPSVEGDGQIDQTEQATAYTAALTAFSRERWIDGAFVWDWSAEGREPPTGGGYSPQGKQAEGVLARFWH